MKPKQIATALAGLFIFFLAGCASRDAASDFGKISTTAPERTNNDADRSGEIGGIGFVQRY